MAEPWEQDQVVEQPQANDAPWENDAVVQQQQPAAAPRIIPPALVNRMSDDTVPLDLSKPYSQRLAEWTARHLKEGDYAATALGTVASTIAGVIEAPFDFAAKAAKAYRQGLTPEQETQAGVEGGMLVSGIESAPSRLPGGAHIADPAVKVAADKAAADILKPADDALHESGLPPEKNGVHGDLANAATLAGAHSEFSTSDGKVGYLPNDEDFKAAANTVFLDQPSSIEGKFIYARLKQGIPNPLEAQKAAAENGSGTTFPAANGNKVGALADNEGIGTGTIEAKLRDLWEQQGVHPAEVAADAARDPTISQSLASPDRADLPRAYDPWAEEPTPAAGGGGHGTSGGSGDLPPEGPQNRKPIFTYTQADRSAFRKSLDFIADEYKKTFQPELVSDAALQADPLFAEYKSKVASEKDAIITRAEDEHQYWRRVSDSDRFAYLDAVERDDMDALSSELRDKAARHRKLLDHAYALEKEVGSKAGYVEEYFPHIWQTPDQARGFVSSKTAQLGPKWFQKERSFDLIREGLDAGLRLKSTNPEDLIVDRLLASADMRERVGLLNELRKRGLATPTKGANIDLAKQGWQTIIGPDRTEWGIAPDVQPLWKNAVEARGFWSNEDMPGSMFRGWMAMKNVWVPIKLALSAFHFLHVLHINWNEGFARSWVQLTKEGDVAGALNSAAEGFYGSVQAAIPGVPHLGKEVRAAWKIPKDERAPDQQAAVTLMNEGGFVPELSEQLRINARHAFEDAIDKGEWLKAVPQSIRRTLEKIQAPLFQEWIPNLKAAAYMHDAQALLARRPDLLEDATQRKVALRTIAKSIDNRFGEMFYGGLFWNRYVKDAGIGSFLSMGWNLGFAREFLGGPLQSVGRLVDRMVNKRTTATEATIADAQNKMPFVLSYVGTAMLINGMMTMAFTGQVPEGLDWIFARTGGTNPDGSPRRVTNMFYLRELPMLLKHVEARGGNILIGAMDMLASKTMFEPFAELLNNRDYYGSDIWDENGPVYLQAWQGLKHVFGDQFNPISISGARRAYLSSGQWGDALLAVLGFGPAPSYVARTPTENRIEYLYKRHVAPTARPMIDGEKARNLYDIRGEVLRAKQNHDRAGVEEAGRKWIEAGGSRQALGNMILGIPGDVSMFRALPDADQKAIMEGATPEERAKYGPFLKTHVAAQAAELIYQSQTLAQQGKWADAEKAKQQLQMLIRGAVQDGTITNGAAFKRSLTQQLIARRSPELSALLALPKKLRAQYGHQLETLH